jgi:hypothetical protein
MFPLAVKARVVRGLMVKQATFGTLVVVGRFIAPFSGVCKEMAMLALLNGFRLIWDTHRHLFSKEKVLGFDDLLDFVSQVVMYYDQHGVHLTFGVLNGTA